MRVELRYEVPVYVVVDLESETVERVVVHDEGVEMASDVPPVDKDTEELVAGDAARRAVELADGESWPRWEFGF